MMTITFQADGTPRNLPSKAVRRRYDVCSRTIARWIRNPNLDFPSPLVINGRLYFDEASLVEWERKRAAKASLAGREDA